MKFLCDDNHIYYCKYRSGNSLNPQEIDFLVYEVVCYFLLKELGIPTPEIAFVHLSKNSFDPKDLKINKKYAKPEVICFGSREVVGNNLITGLEIVSSKKDFIKYSNPQDLIRISFFDLWVANTDRGREQNFNLLADTYLKKTRILAFDQAFTFHGESGLGAFNSKWPINTNHNLAKTQFFKSIIRFIPKAERELIAKKMLDLLPEITEVAVDRAFGEIGRIWGFSPRLKERMIKFLSNKERINTIKGEFLLLSLRFKK